MKWIERERVNSLNWCLQQISVLRKWRVVRGRRLYAEDSTPSAFKILWRRKVIDEPMTATETSGVALVRLTYSGAEDKWNVTTWQFRDLFCLRFSSINSPLDISSQTATWTKAYIYNLLESAGKGLIAGQNSVCHILGYCHCSDRLGQDKQGSNLDNEYGHIWYKRFRKATSQQKKTKPWPKKPKMVVRNWKCYLWKPQETGKPKSIEESMKKK